jgi:hypothetical protein
VACQKKAD